MLKLNASYSKKVPAEGEYSSQSYHASIEVVKKYPPNRVDTAYRNLTTLFGLDGNRALLWT